MTLLKDDGTAPAKPQPKYIVVINRWPTERRPEGIGLSVKDGWNLSIGFGLGMAIAVPLILLALACILGVGLTILGGSLGALL